MLLRALLFSQLICSCQSQTPSQELCILITGIHRRHGQCWGWGHCLKEKIGQVKCCQKFHPWAFFSILQISINFWVDKYNAVYPYNGMILARKRSGVQTCATAWWTLKTCFGETSHSGPNTVDFSKGKSIETETRLVVFWGRRNWGWRDYGSGVQGNE